MADEDETKKLASPEEMKRRVASAKERIVNAMAPPGEKKKMIVIDPGFWTRPTLDKDGKPLSREEADKYLDDLFDHVPLSSKYVEEYLWPKWGERLGIEKTW